MSTFIDEYGEKEDFKKVRELDLENGIICIDNYSTVLPISSPDYQKNHPTKTKINTQSFDNEIIFNITDDYGKTYSLIITGKEMKNPIVQNQLAKIKKIKK